MSLNFNNHSELRTIQECHNPTYLSIKEASLLWGISPRRILTLCTQNRISGAVRIGNSWAIPNTSIKPEDARLKKDMIHEGKWSERKARSCMKRAVIDVYGQMKKTGQSTTNAKMQTIAIFSTILVKKTNGTLGNIPLIESDELRVVEKIISDSCSVNYSNIKEMDEEYLQKNFIDNIPFFLNYLDDILSWAYQYLNKVSLDTGLESTQFFTEKYMIKTLIERADFVDKRGKILDPACGGGNFLLYAFDSLVENIDSKNDIRKKEKEKIIETLYCLYGYEIDECLSIVASINLKIRTLKEMFVRKIPFTLEEWIELSPNIYHPRDYTIGGFLDKPEGNQIVIRVGDSKIGLLSEIVEDVKFIFTNPPFQTVKGMKKELKEFLKTEYPDSKCDLCNAFIQRIIAVSNNDTLCGMVTQNSWMFLHSTRELREKILQECSFKLILNLGPGAFYDLSGEKSSVSLIKFICREPTDNVVQVIDLRDKKHIGEENLLLKSELIDDVMSFIPQNILRGRNGEINFSKDFIDKLRDQFPTYGKFAIPMQGTSTGNSAELIDYHWKYSRDNDWVIVSKGGGYSRWSGLNKFVVKWGRKGEYVRSTKGSALRNIDYFDETDLVFSDTGTSGLNVRLLKQNQIFVASGPGIRIIDGNKYAHLAFLNSRYSSYIIKKTTPKLTIAAGYIANIPVNEKLLHSEQMISFGNKCWEIKNEFLQVRPTNIEFSHDAILQFRGLCEKQSLACMKKDFIDELNKLIFENKIDEIVETNMNLTDIDINHLDRAVGKNAININNSHTLDIGTIDDQFESLLNEECVLKKTRPDKKGLGCDGVLEYISKLEQINPVRLLDLVIKNIDSLPKLKNKYHNFWLHNIVLCGLDFGNGRQLCSVSMDELVKNIQYYLEDCNDINMIKKWIKSSFNDIHNKIFFKSPLFKYDETRQKFFIIGDNK